MIPKPEVIFNPFPLYILDRTTMSITEVTVTKVTDSRYYIDRVVSSSGTQVSRGDRGGSNWLHSGLTPEGNVFDTGPTSLGSKDRWIIAYGRSKEALVDEVKTRQQAELDRVEKALKTDKMWLAGFKAMNP